jgi:MoxR-like ATPase
VFKANSAILNALLTLLNEREFDNGSGRLRTPLVSVVAASNEVPVDEALHAFYDRFLVRVPVAPVGDDSFAALLSLRPGRAAACDALGEADRAAVAQAAAGVALGDAALRACAALRRWLGEQGLAVSDRRWRQWIGLMRTAAATEGRAELDAIDLWSAPYVVSPTPDCVARVARWVDEQLLQVAPQDAPWLTRAVEAFERQLQIEQSAPAEGHDDAGAGKLALARAIGGAGEDMAMLRMVTDKLEQALARRYSSVHVAARCVQVDEVLARARQARAEIAQDLEQLATALAPRLWIPPSQVKQWLEGPTQTLRRLDPLIARLQELRAAFAALPMDDGMGAAAPPPIDLAVAAA